MKNFALIGVAGFVAPRHLKAIQDTGNRLVAAVDPHESVGILDSYFPEAKYFKDLERFDRFLDKLQRGPQEERIHYISICSPNYLHDTHIRLALRSKSNVICEKPLVVRPWNLEGLRKLEEESGFQVFTVLQLRLNPKLIELKKKINAEGLKKRREVKLSYITPRGPWYKVSWKGSEEKSGGPVMNIGIHLFDLVLWLFGPMEKSDVNLLTQSKASGVLELQKATVRWRLSIDRADLSKEHLAHSANPSIREMVIDGEVVEFSDGFTDLHTKVYKDILDGKGFGINEARPSIELVNHIRESYSDK